MGGGVGLAAGGCVGVEGSSAAGVGDGTRVADGEGGDTGARVAVGTGEAALGSDVIVGDGTTGVARAAVGAGEASARTVGVFCTGVGSVKSEQATATKLTTSNQTPSVAALNARLRPTGGKLLLAQATCLRTVDATLTRA